jgi:hypothetical protein
MMFFNKFLEIALPRVLRFLRYIGGCHYEWPWSVAGSQVRDRHVSCAQVADIKSEEAVIRGVRRDQSAAESCRILHFPKPDYKRIPPKVDCWRKKQQLGGDDKKVGGAIT